MRASSWRREARCVRFILFVVEKKELTDIHTRRALHFRSSPLSYVFRSVSQKEEHGGVLYARVFYESIVRTEHFKFPPYKLF